MSIGLRNGESWVRIPLGAPLFEAKKPLKWIAKSGDFSLAMKQDIMVDIGMVRSIFYKKRSHG